MRRFSFTSSSSNSAGSGFLSGISRAIGRVFERGATIAQIVAMSDEDFIGRRSTKSASGVAVTEESSLGLPAILCAIRTFSERLGSLPFVLYERTDQGKERAESHPLYEILHDEPNPIATAMHFVSSMTGQALLFGNAYAEIEWDTRRGEVVALWPLWNSQVTAKCSADGRTIWYEVKDTPEGSVRVLSFERVFHLPGFGLGNFLGLMPIEVCRDAVGLGLALQRFAGAFFGNGAWPGGVVTTPDGVVLSDEKYDELKRQLDEVHKGAENSHQSILLEGGLKMEKMSANPAESQSLESRQFSVLDVARIFGIPPHLLMDLTHSTKSNIEAQGLEFKESLQPWGERWKKAVRKYLLLPGEKKTYFAEFLWESMVQTDVNARYEAYSKARQWGWMCVDEIRARENLNVLPDQLGQRYLEAENMIEVGAARKQDAAEPQPDPQPNTDGTTKDTKDTKTAGDEVDGADQVDAAEGDEE